jgi:hypothetical protein
MDGEGVAMLEVVKAAQAPGNTDQDQRRIQRDGAERIRSNPLKSARGTPRRDHRNARYEVPQGTAQLIGIHGHFLSA